MLFKVPETFKLHLERNSIQLYLSEGDILSKTVETGRNNYYEKELWKEIEEFLRDKLSSMEKIFYCYTAADKKEMQEIIDQVMTRGKRLRPILLLLSGSIEPYEPGEEILIKAAAAAELVHTASLIHDDVIDSSATRRGKPTINYKWGNISAVLAGDFIFARAFELLSDCQELHLNESFTRAISMMCQGEIAQSKLIFDTIQDETQYLDNIYCKTAVLMETCCGAGASLSGLDRSSIGKLKEFGKYFGLAFQIVDDLLDVTAPSSLTGKPAVKDLQEGVITLPLIYVLQDPVWGPYLKDAIEKRDFSPSSLEFLQHPSCRGGPIKSALLKAEDYILKAENTLRGYPQGRAVKSLKALAELMRLHNNSTLQE